MQYADRDDVINVRSEFLSLASSDAGGWGRFGALRRHFVEYPGASAPDARDLVYWSKEVVARRTGRERDAPGDPSVRQRIRRPRSRSAPSRSTARHYFDASLGLTVLVPDPSSASPATYVAYLNRSRVDVIGGMFGGVAKKIIASKARSTVADQLDGCAPAWSGSSLAIEVGFQLPAGRQARVSL